MGEAGDAGIARAMIAPSGHFGPDDEFDAVAGRIVEPDEFADMARVAFLSIAVLNAVAETFERGRRPREYAPALRDLEGAQKTRAKRRQLDVVDRGLIDLVSVYRDAIAVASGAPGDLVNEEIRPDVKRIVETSSPELNLQRIGWIFEAREQMLEFNVPIPLALESMMVALRVPSRS